MDAGRRETRRRLRSGRTGVDRLLRARPSASRDRFRQADLRLLRVSIAATLPGDRVAVSHLGSAILRHWPVWAEKAHACATTWDVRVRRVAGLHLHREMAEQAYVRREGIPVTSATRTIADVAREFGTEAALVPGDVALRRRDITREGLLLEVERCAGLPGVDAARRVAHLLDPLAVSPLESRSRWHVDLHGIDRPLSQVWTYTRGGVFLGRVEQCRLSDFTRVAQRRSYAPRRCRLGPSLHG